VGGRELPSLREHDGSAGGRPKAIFLMVACCTQEDASSY